jgi:hypothetical protein
MYVKKHVVNYTGTSVYKVKMQKGFLRTSKSSGSCLGNREYGRRDPSRSPRGTLYPQKLAIISPTCGGHSVGIVRSRTQTMEFSLVLVGGITLS